MLCEDCALPDLSGKTTRGYKPFRPVALWPDLRHVTFSAETQVEARATDGMAEESEGAKTHRAKRKRVDQAERNDSFILHKFEAILSWAEFINLNRRVEDDDDDSAKMPLMMPKKLALVKFPKPPQPA